ncbi:MAG: SLAC1 anion channel family protein [Gammaproteobacteria bacterium]|nr:SLAC1 anion channel family protein [Gammaproteobacteria bacterium]
MNQSSSRIINFPISFFAIVMGMAGFSIALKKAESVFNFTPGAGQLITHLTIALCLLVAMIYGLKIINYREAVVKELHHPVKLSFFPAFSISLLLIAIAVLDVYPGIARIVWFVGASAHLVFTLYVMNSWINHTHFEIHHMNPSWFIPIVGNILVPIAGVPLGYEEVSWLFFSIGILFWPVLLSIIFYRVIFHKPLPEKLVPTFFILIAPPAVGFISWYKLTGEIDSFARILYFSAIFFFLLLFSQASKFMRLKFFISWWAYSFPMAAITIASMLMYEATAITGYLWISYLLFVLLCLFILILLIKTFVAIAQKNICIEE